MAGAVGVVVHRVSGRVVVIDPRFVMADDCLGFVVGDVDDLVIRRLDHHDVVFDVDVLFVVGIYVAGRVRFLADTLDRLHQALFLIGNSLTQFPGPIDVFVQQCQCLWVVEQGND